MKALFQPPRAGWPTQAGFACVGETGAPPFREAKRWDEQKNRHPPVRLVRRGELAQGRLRTPIGITSRGKAAAWVSRKQQYNPCT
jgi:hypothetical protein